VNNAYIIQLRTNKTVCDFQNVQIVLNQTKGIQLPLLKYFIHQKRFQMLFLIF